MIKLDIQEYCQECDGFEPVKEESVVETKIMWDDNLTRFYEKDITETLVRCRYRKRCAAMCRYLRTQKTDI